MRWKNWSDFKGQHSMNFREEDWSKIKTRSLNSRPEFRNYRMKLIVWMIREILKMLNQHAVDYTTFPVNRRFSHLFVILGRKDKPPDIWDTHGVSGNVFVNPLASSSSPYPQGLNPWISNVSEHTSPHVLSERQTPDTALDPRCQSGPSARNSFDPCEGRFSKDYVADQQRLQISELHFDKFPTPTTFACWKIRFKIEVCTCSQFPTEAMLWIKEVEMVESVDDLKSSRSNRGTPGPDFELLDARLASALNNIIQNTRFKKVVSLEEQKAQNEDRFLRWRQIVYPIYEYFRVTGANDSVENYADLFTIVLRNDDIQEFDSKWDETLLSMTQIPSDDILESLYKLRIRESEKLKTVLELYNLEIHQKKAGTDYHRLKTMVKRSIEQNVRMNHFEARNGNYETSAVVKNQGIKQRERRSTGDCWQWKANGQCSEGDNCSFRHDMNKRAKSTQPNLSPRFSMQQSVRNASRTRSPGGRSPSWKMARLPCKDYLKGTCTNPFCDKWHPPECLFYKSEKGCRFGEKSSHAHRQVDEQPSKRSQIMVTKVQWLCWKLHDNWVAYFKICSRRCLHRFYGRAQTYWNQSDMFDSQKPWYVMLTFETRVHRLEWFAQVILISVTPMLQNLRIGFKKRRNGKSDVPVKQRGCWPNYPKINGEK